METRSKSPLELYYAKRADEYERIYAKPERQRDLGLLRELIAEAFIGQDVLEIACGTGYWTQVVARSARSITAIDINEEVLSIARTKPQTEHVNYLCADCFSLRVFEKKFSAALAAFWWSHVEKSRIKSFLETLHRTLLPGATVIFMDNRYVEGSSTPISRVDAEGNTYQRRQLADGITHEVLKNFPTEEELVSAIEPFGRLTLQWSGYYWLARYSRK